VVLSLEENGPASSAPTPTKPPSAVSLMPRASPAGPPRGARAAASPLAGVLPPRGEGAAEAASRGAGYTTAASDREHVPGGIPSPKGRQKLLLQQLGVPTDPQARDGATTEGTPLPVNDLTVDAQPHAMLPAPQPIAAAPIGLSGMEMEAAWQLEVWKAAEEAKWRAELKEREVTCGRKPHAVLGICGFRQLHFCDHACAIVWFYGCRHHQAGAGYVDGHPSPFKCAHAIAEVWQ